MKPVTTKDYDLYKIRLDAVLTRTIELFREHDRRKAEERKQKRKTVTPDTVNLCGPS